MRNRNGMKIRGKLLAILGAGILAVSVCTKASEVSAYERSAKAAESVTIKSEDQITELIAEQWESDYYEAITVEPGSDEMEKDGKSETFSEEFGVSEKKAEDVTSSKEKLSSYLNDSTEDAIYDVQSESDGTLTVTEPYQLQRIIVDRTSIHSSYGAEKMYVNPEDGETILQYESQEATRSAYRSFCKEYGEEHCCLDMVVSAESTEEAEILSASETQHTVQEKLKNNGKMTLSGSTQNYSEDILSWGIYSTGMNVLKEQAGQKGYTQQIKVAVIDTGADVSHEMLSGRVDLSASYNFFKNNHKVNDGLGHGTHVAGIIAQATPSNVRLVILKIGDSQGKTTLLMMRTALKYARTHNVDLINLSMGYTAKKAYKLTYLNKEIEKLYKKKVPIITAAGNSGANVKTCYPACNTKTISVSALNDSLKIAYYSNRGKRIKFAGPGSDIISAFPGGRYAIMDGTSMAAPHITAEVAYLKMKNKGISVSAVVSKLKGYSRDLGKKGRDTSYGYGFPVISTLFDAQSTTAAADKNTTKIDSPAPVIQKAVNTKEGIRVTWKVQTGTAGYEVYRQKGNTWKKMATAGSKTSSWTDKTVVQGKTYVYMVKHSGQASSTKTIVCQKPVEKLKVKSAGSGKINITWKKRGSISGYEIQYSRSKKMVKPKTVKIGKNSRKTAVRVKNAGKYYCRIRTRYKKGKLVYYSAWSGKVKAK